MTVIDQKALASISPESVLERAARGIRRPDISRLLRQPVQWDLATVVLRNALDEIDQRLRTAVAVLHDDDADPESLTEIDDAMGDLLTVLWSLKSTSTPDAWKRVCAQCLAHPLRNRIHEDPFASRCFNKPRGYPGDAVLIDYLYARRPLPEEDARLTTLGRRIFEFTLEIPAGHAVRRRRDLVASAIDELCARSPHPRILSVACGHLREAALSHAVAERQVDRFVALDQDALSLQIVESEVGHLGVTTMCNSIKSLFRGDVARDKFDFIYTTGLFDYLDDRIASKLTERMFDMLNPGGRLLIANFVPDVWCSAYMEAFLDWNLIYRTDEQMLANAAEIDKSRMATCETFLEENRNVVFLDITKA